MLWLLEMLEYFQSSVLTLIWHITRNISSLVLFHRNSINNEGHRRPHEKKWNFPNSTFQNLEMDKHLEVAVCPFPNFGKFGKNEKHVPAVATLLGVHSPVFGHRQEKQGI